MLTKPQATALAKWRDGKPHNEVEIKVRSDVYHKLRWSGMLYSPYWRQLQITEAGRKALEEYEAKHGQIK